MKYMNLLRKLALLSSLALSFAVHADGTLPLPGKKRPVELIGVAKAKLPLSEADSVRLEVRVNDFNAEQSTPHVPGIGNPCERGAAYYEGSGMVTHGNQTFDLAGVCIPSGSSSTASSGSLPRVVVATDGSRLLLLSGVVTYTANEITKFSGELSVKGAGALPVMKFELNPIP